MKRRSLSHDLGLRGQAEAQRAPLRIDTLRVADLVRVQAAPAAGRPSMAAAKMRRAALIALAAALVLCVTVIATGGSSRVKQRAVTDEPFSSLPTPDQAMEAADFVPLMPECFSNGFVFSHGWLNEYAINEGSEKGAHVRSYYFIYALPEEQGFREVELRELPWQDDGSVSFLSGEPVAEIDGITVYDLEREQFDSSAQKTGVYLHALHWQQGALQCRLSEWGGIGLDTLLQMAAELIRGEA